ncbi:MAG: ribosome maturation factor RimM [Candidatus Izimaplasma sp.]|nr:ribosome maturation factor RimM [Candidatus Izimaplasma bacterium]
MTYIKVGTIVNTHALKGVLRVKTFSDSEERFLPGNSLYVKREEDYFPLTIERAAPHKTLLHIKFKEHTSIEDNEHLKNHDLFVKEIQLTPLKEDEFYLHDLYGLDVYLDDKKIGTINTLIENATGHLIDIKRPNKKNVLIPFLKRFTEVDLSNNRVLLKNTEGLL